MTLVPTLHCKHQGDAGIELLQHHKHSCTCSIFSVQLITVKFWMSRIGLDQILPTMLTTLIAPTPNSEHRLNCTLIDNTHTHTHTQARTHTHKHAHTHTRVLMCDELFQLPTHFKSIITSHTSKHIMIHQFPRTVWLKVHVCSESFKVTIMWKEWTTP